jgi:phage terminase small subunit
MKSLDPDNLTIRERKFLENIMLGMKRPDAYLAAGYNVASRNKVRASAANLLARPKVRAALDKMQKNHREYTDVTKEEIIRYLTDVLRSAPGHVDSDSPLAQEYSITENAHSSNVRIKMVSKIDAIKHLTLLLGFDPPQKVQHDAADPLKSLLLRLRGAESKTTEQTEQ